MTDRQFDAYQKGLLRELKRVKDDFLKNPDSTKNETLDKLIKDIEEQLQRP